jgi:hypothetical protein
LQAKPQGGNMVDQSNLDRKYFIDNKVYNCPFCNRNNVIYSIERFYVFDWNNSKSCHAIFVKCSSCEKTSMHLSFTKIYSESKSSYYYKIIFNPDIEIDSNIFYSVPTSFFTIDDRIPKIIRELITEAEGCIKMNFLTGASACMRKSIYELLILEKIEGDHYEEKIKSLKTKYPNSDPELFDILSNIQQMTSDKIHEQSWDEWDSDSLKLIIETLKTVLHDIYVLPKIKEDRLKQIGDLRKKVLSNK